MSQPSSILQCNDVTVEFDGFKAIQGMSLNLEKGELRFLIGPNGAGKTTMLDVICGKVRPSTGQVTFNGDIDITRKKSIKLPSWASGASSRLLRFSPP